GWSDHPEQAGVITRAMAIEAARVQLGAGRDVIIPQYLGRVGFVLELEQLARQTGAEFVEVLLTGDPEQFARRFARRAADPGDPAHADAPRRLARDVGARACRESQGSPSALVGADPRHIP